MILPKRENARELKKWCDARGIAITQTELMNNFTSYELQVSRRSACLHGTMPRKLKLYLAKRDGQSHVRTVRRSGQLRLFPDYRSRQANDDTFR